MDHKIKALLEVAVAYILIFGIKLLTSLQIFSFLSVIRVLSSYGNIVIFYLAAAAFILVLLAVTGRDFSRYGISLRNARDDLKSVAICAIPILLASMSLLIFNGGSIETSILLSAIEVLLLLVIARSLRGMKNNDNKATVGMLIIIPALLALLSLAMIGDTTLMLIYIFLLVGPVEELIFRGYLQSRINEAFGRPYKFFGVNLGAGVIIASLLFGLWHMLNGFNPFYNMYSLILPWGIWSFFSGLTLGFVREKTDGLLAPSLLHAVFDMPLMVLPLLLPV